ncbi:MAG: PadR family transcriptional regulator [Candidatus Hermodarchaeota archaeon]
MNPLSRFKKGAIIAHIMYHAKKNPFYGVWLKEELARHGYKISDGTLYPWLNRIAKSGYLTLEERLIEGKIRKYYSITKAGEEHFNEIKRYLKELYDEMIEE